jgi:hypothetical protein
MERVATYEASLRNWEDQLSERAAKAERGEQTPAQGGTGITGSSPTDAQGDTIDVEAQAEELAGAIYSGDRDEAKTKLAAVLASIKSDAIKAAQASVKQTEASGRSQADLDAEAKARSDANAVFLNEFPELNTPVLKGAALDMVKKVAKDPVMIGRPLSEITREACTRVRDDVFQGKPPPAPKAPAATGSPTPLIPATQAPPATDLATRHNLKRRTVLTPINEAHGRAADTPAQEQKIPSNKEYVGILKRGRGQPA